VASPFTLLWEETFGVKAGDHKTSKTAKAVKG
jgi:hypothetical protein